MRYVQGNQPNVPAPTTHRHSLYNSMVCARTSRYQTDHRDIYAIAIAIARTNVPLSYASTWTLFHHPPH